ncbi:MAG: hypothetical protein WCS79_08950 [Paludibacter sp.]
MNQNSSTFNKQFYFQIFLYLFVNSLFILKYFPRAGASGTVILGGYVVFVLTGIFLYNFYNRKIAEKTFKLAFWILLVFMVIIIATLLIKIDRYSVRVDRWSAVTFFLDNLFQGKYPYSAHTHVSNTNFASPFPVWHIINIPFYLLGDVGIGLIFFLLLTACVLRYFFTDYRKSFFFLLMLSLAPAYWWEVAVRSDSLNNALLVFAFILWFKKRDFTLSQNLWIGILATGLIATTRLSALLPLSLFFFKPYIQLQWKQKIIFPLGVLGVIMLFFLPFIFWNTNTWIFFTRNPFMSQTSVGNPYLLLIMIFLGGYLAFRWKNTHQFFAVTSIFLFIFILTSQISLMLSRGIHGSVFEDSLYDVSYFTLLLPYCLAYLSYSIVQNKNMENPISKEI